MLGTAKREEKREREREKEKEDTYLLLGYGGRKERVFDTIPLSYIE